MKPLTLTGKRYGILLNPTGEALQLTPNAHSLIERRVVLGWRHTRLVPLAPQAKEIWATLLVSESPKLSRFPGLDGNYVVHLRPKISESDPTVKLLTFFAPSHPLDITPAAQLYDLSPAETRLAEALVNSGSHDGAMKILGISRNTVRAQMASIFRKTETARQGELIRLFTKIATFAQMCDDF